MAELWASLREFLVIIAESDWLHQFGLILGITLVCWMPAKLLCRRWPLLGPGYPLYRRLTRRSVRASLWPLLSIVVGLVTLKILVRLWPQIFGESEGVISILGLLLGLRILEALTRPLDPGREDHRGLRRTLLVLLFSVVALDQLDLLNALVSFLERPIFSGANSSVTSLSILAAMGALMLMGGLASMAQHQLGHRVLPRLGVDYTLAEALATVARYFLVIAGGFWALDLLGFDLSTIGFAVGALGVGIGMGLQGIVNNFVSGLILMFERSIKRGDVLTVEGTDGKVQRIGLRASVIRSRDGEDLIMPNSIFTDNTITNYSFGDDLKLVDVAVGVSYDSDPNEIRDLLLEVAAKQDTVLERPAPLVRFRDFGASSIDFELRAWIRDPWGVPAARSDLLFAIWYALKDRGIEIPFPQHDLHLRSGELPVRMI
ncbi:hypothetical protein DRQ53_07790, partial [bacterium]